MTKPVITNRVSKGSALTYAELDTNFQNLKDATIGVSDGTNSYNFNLNDVISIGGAGGATVGVNPSTGAITITSGNGTVNSGAAGAIPYYPSAGTNLDDTGIKYEYLSGSTTDRVYANTLEVAARVGTGSPNARITVRNDGNIFLFSDDVSIVADGGTDSSVLELEGRSTSAGVTVNNRAASPLATLFLGNGGNSTLVGATNGLTLKGNLTDIIDGYNVPSITLGASYGTSISPKSDITISVPEGTVKVNTDLLSNNTACPSTFDISANAVSRDASATIDYNNFAGILFAQREDDSIGMWLCAGNTVTSLGSTTAGSVSYQSAINGYRWTNNTGSTITVSMFSVRMSTSS
jgi:hypothetical protein